MKELLLVPMSILSNLAMLSLFRILGNERGEVDVSDPDPQPTPQPDPEPNATPQPSEFDKLLKDKGLKSPDELASLYRKNESEWSRTQNHIKTSKQQLEQHGYTYDENGNVVQVQQDGSQQFNQQQQQNFQQQQQQQQQAEPIYDPYSGQILTNPIDLQLAQLPPAQRMAVFFNAMMAQNENQKRDSFAAENEVLSDPSAKGFEDDVRKVMGQIPLAQRTRKEAWQDALLKVKGMKYDEAVKNAGADGVQQFINKETFQNLPAGGGGNDNGVRLTPEQEQGFQYYQKNNPGMFKDRAHYMKRLQPTG